MACRVGVAVPDLDVVRWSLTGLASGLVAETNQGFLSINKRHSIELDAEKSMPPGVYPVTVSGEAEINGESVSFSRSASIEVLVPTTAVSGRVV